MSGTGKNNVPHFTDRFASTPKCLFFTSNWNAYDCTLTMLLKFGNPLHLARHMSTPPLTVPIVAWQPICDAVEKVNLARRRFNSDCYRSPRRDCWCMHTDSERATVLLDAGFVDGDDRFVLFFVSISLDWTGTNPSNTDCHLIWSHACSMHVSYLGMPIHKFRTAVTQAQHVHVEASSPLSSFLPSSLPCAHDPFHCRRPRQVRLYAWEQSRAGSSTRHSTS